MCSDDCKCYDGEGGETKKLWEAVGDEELAPFYRNTLKVKTNVIKKNGDVVPIYPF